MKNRLREIRHELMIDSQKDMAALIGVHWQQYNRYEKQQKQPSLETVLKIAKKLNKPIEAIVYLEPE